MQHNSTPRTLRHKFVKKMPDRIEPGILYISIQFATAIHACACGCGQEVVTPLTPTDWRFTFDGETVSLEPSIGNWDFPCQSHYWISKNKIIMAGKWGKSKIEGGRIADKERKNSFFFSRKK